MSRSSCSQGSRRPGGSSCPRATPYNPAPSTSQPKGSFWATMQPCASHSLPHTRLNEHLTLFGGFQVFWGQPRNFEARSSQVGEAFPAACRCATHPPPHSAHNLHPPAHRAGRVDVGHELVQEAVVGLVGVDGVEGAPDGEAAHGGAGGHILLAHRCHQVALQGKVLACGVSKQRSGLSTQMELHLCSLVGQQTTSSACASACISATW